MSTAITSNPEILGGTPVFVGTRVPVESLFNYLIRGHSISYFLEQFPAVSREQVDSVLADARQHAVAEVSQS
ncbi:DUF433 domain-containing protein [Aeoliella sp. SH292]|uniref:DUF433 domain-containing protein n=1 Tax=Aeoliella sp. SH292 TaxID=3454464 RepID=UPI003F9A3C3F